MYFARKTEVGSEFSSLEVIVINEVAIAFVLRRVGMFLTNELREIIDTSKQKPLLKGKKGGGSTMSQGIKRPSKTVSPLITIFLLSFIELYIFFSK